MAGTSFTVDYDDQLLQEALNRLLKLTTDTEPVMMEIAEYLHQGTRDHFDNEEDPDGNAWAPLQEATRKRKSAMGVSIDKILHGEHLHLRDTIFPFWDSEQAGVSTGPGTEAYAATHQFGAPERNISERPFLGIGSEDEREILDIIEEEILSALEGA